MKQILQDMGSGQTLLMEIPRPQCNSNSVLVRTRASLVSAGTERMLVNFGKASYLEKARQQPEKVRMVLDKCRTDGVVTTMEAVRSKLAQPLPLGYCNVGTVVEGGANTEFTVGDRVVSNGPHASVVVVPSRLCAKIPDSVDDETASFTVLGSIALQGIRLAQPTLGECFVVTGAGLIGLLAVQLLVANGCSVLAIDFDPAKLALARQFGAEICNAAQEDPLEAAARFSHGRGIDGVLITASTKSSEPVSHAARMCRKRGRIVLVGVTGLELNRADFYEKELTFQVSCSYGPGRYDPAYEEKGHDYPLGHVRWTEQRNFEAVIDMMARGRLETKPLVTRRFAFDQAQQAYDYLTEDPGALGIVLQYPPTEGEQSRLLTLPRQNPPPDPRLPVLSLIGAGNYASRMLVPALKIAGAQLDTVASPGGTSAAILGNKAGFRRASSDVDAVINDPASSVIVVATRHDSHAPLVAKALRAGKHVFVEKPLAIDDAGVDAVEAALSDSAGREVVPQLMVGFNRRFAPQVRKMHELLSTVGEPKSFIMLMNAGAIPPDHWTQNDLVGGGRIVGEACHYIDLMRFFAGSPIVSVQGRRLGVAGGGSSTQDTASIVLGFADGSCGTVHYFANGSSKFPKERIEVFTAGRVLQLDNFRALRGYGWRGFDKMNLWRQDKGQAACVSAFLDGVKTGTPAIPQAEILEVSRATLRAERELREQ